MKAGMITILVLIILLTAVSMAVHAYNNHVERQKYTVSRIEKGFEIRFYPKALMATVVTPLNKDNNVRNNNFRRLAGYIFGGNKESKTFAMTAPVHMEQDAHTSKMSFVLPSGTQLNDLPNPNDSSVKFNYSDEGYYGALRFGGFSSEKRIRRKEAELKAMLLKAGYETIGNFTYLGYNAPWDIINRENDIIVKIKYR